MHGRTFFAPDHRVGVGKEWQYKLTQTIILVIKRSWSLLDSDSKS